jgi:hypothetical protein
MTKILLLCLIFLSACNGPSTRDRSKAYRQNGSSGQFADPITFDESNAANQRANDQVFSNTTSGASSSDNAPEGTEGCTWSYDGTSNFKYQSTFFGPYNACKNTKFSNRVHVQLAYTFNGRLCIGPLKYSGNGFTLIGKTTCTQENLSSSTKVSYFDLVVDRSGAVSGDLNAIILTKYEEVSFGSPYNTSRTYYPAEAFELGIYYNDLGNSSFIQTFKTFGRYHSHKF